MVEDNKIMLFARVGHYTVNGTEENWFGHLASALSVDYANLKSSIVT